MVKREMRLMKITTYALIVSAITAAASLIGSILAPFIAKGLDLLYP